MMLHKLKPVTSIHPETVIKLYVTKKKFYIILLCYIRKIADINIIIIVLSFLDNKNNKKVLI